MMGTFAIGMGSSNIKAIAEGRVAGKLAFDIIERKPKIQYISKHGQNQNIGSIEGKIEFKNVSFTYSSRPDTKVLNDFSAIFEQGKTTAIVGASGSGKSTIVQLIERFYDLNDGIIEIDGQNIKEIDLGSLRNQIGYVG